MMIRPSNVQTTHALSLPNDSTNQQNHTTMKPQTPFKTLLLLVLLVAAGMLVSCEKLEQAEEQQQQGPPSYASSDVDLQGTWDCISLVPSSDTCYLRVTFFEHYFSTDIKGWYYLKRYEMNPQWPSGGYFNDWTRCNYLIYNGEFYMWNRELSPVQWVEMPFYANIPPTFDASLHGDTLDLQCLFTRENCPDVDLPDESHYTFVKLNR